MKIEYVLLLAVILIGSLFVLGTISQKSIRTLNATSQSLEKAVEAVK